MWNQKPLINLTRGSLFLEAETNFPNIAEFALRDTREGLLKVADNVVSILYTNRKTHKVIFDAQSQTFSSGFFVEAHERRLFNKAFDTAQARGNVGNTHTVNEIAGGLQIACNFKADHAAETSHLGSRHFIIRMRGQTRIPNALNFGMA